VNEREKNKMNNNTVSLLANLFLSSTLFWGVPAAQADELVNKEAASLSYYCHTQFPAMRPDILSWDRPVLDEAAGNVNDFYDSCDDDSPPSQGTESSFGYRVRVNSGMGINYERE
jgi:hypothetical protein